MALIQMTPEELIQAKDTLGIDLSTLQDIVSQIDSTVNGILGDWEGESQTAFTDSYQRMLGIIQKNLPEIIMGIQKQLAMAADQLKTADSNIANAFS